MNWDDLEHTLNNIQQQLDFLYYHLDLEEEYINWVEEQEAVSNDLLHEQLARFKKATSSREPTEDSKEEE